MTNPNFNRLLKTIGDSLKVDNKAVDTKINEIKTEMKTEITAEVSAEVKTEVNAEVTAKIDCLDAAKATYDEQSSEFELLKKQLAEIEVRLKAVEDSIKAEPIKEEVK